MQSLGLLLHDAARLLRSEFEKRARCNRMSLMQWRTLGALAKSDGVNQRDLAARVEATAMTMSDILDRLEAEGLVRRAPDPDDGRAKRVWMTEAAEPVVKEMKAIAADVYGKALDGLDDDERDVLVRALTKITANLDPAANENR